MSGTKSRRGSHFKRRRRRGSYLGVTGKYPTRQNQHSLFYESLRERDLFALLAFQTEVRRVEDHPFQLTYQHGGRARRYTPDAMVEYHSGPADVIEVKLEYELERKRGHYEGAFAAAEKECESKDQRFRIVTEAVLQRPMVRSLRFLLPYRQFPRNLMVEAKILERLVSPARLQDVCRALNEEGIKQGEAIAQIWRLVAIQEIYVDLEQPLSMNSKLEAKPWSTKL